MTGGMWPGLLASLAIVMGVVSLWANLRETAARFGERSEAIAFGLVMGIGAILSICLAVPFAPGILLDLRAAPLAMAGFFGGPLAAAIAATLGLTYRVELGGVGTVSGVLTIVLVSGASVALRRFIGRRPLVTADVLGLAAVSAIAMLLSFLGLPQSILVHALVNTGPASAFLCFLSVLLAGSSLLGEERRRDMARSHALYRAVIDALPDCLNVKDVEGRFIAANPATARLMGAASADQLIGKTDFDFYPDEVARRFRDEELTTLARGKEETIEQQAAFDNGRSLFLATLKVPFRDSRGETIGIITHNRDVTTTQVMQLELRKARQHLAEALQHMADGLVMHDEAVRIVICNEQYRALFPLTADLRIPGASLADILVKAVERGEQILPPDVDLATWADQIAHRVTEGGDRMIGLADGRWLEMRTRAISFGGSLTVVSDVTARQQQERALRHKAEHDSLTGLANRATFETRLAHLYETATARQTEFAVMLLDLDRFKHVNDSFGHAVGDQFLIEIGRRLEDACRHGDFVARLGGDEFAILSEGFGLEKGAAIMAQRVLDKLAMPFQAGPVTLLPSASIGYTLFPKDGSEPAIMVQHADQALYAAKASRHRRWAAYGRDRKIKAVG